MNLPDSIKTISSFTEFKLKEKGSLFTAYSEPIQNEEEALAFLLKIKKEFYDATHHCYAYKIMDGAFKYSDDGEPNGTAGIRIYNAQNHFELTNLITVVVRYFGGTKLGVGPLGKAYYEAAFECLNSANKNTLIKFHTLEIQFDFSLSKTVHHFIGAYNALVKENTYTDKPGIIILVKSSFEKDFINELQAASNNRCEIIKKEQHKFLMTDDNK